jgi:dihydroorotate dehydrogenase
MREKAKHGYTVDIIGCGGIEDGRTYADFTQLGVRAAQYWTAMIYRGPLAAAHILREAGHGHAR